MKRDEALKIIGVLETADGGCSHCIRQLMNLMNKMFPEFDWQEIRDEFNVSPALVKERDKACDELVI